MCYCTQQYNNINNYLIKKSVESKKTSTEVITNGDLEQSKKGKGEEEISKSER